MLQALWRHPHWSQVPHRCIALDSPQYSEHQQATTTTMQLHLSHQHRRRAIMKHHASGTMPLICNCSNITVFNFKPPGIKHRATTYLFRAELPPKIINSNLSTLHRHNEADTTVAYVYQQARTAATLSLYKLKTYPMHIACIVAKHMRTKNLSQKLV